jgi:hypothetical protein
MEVGLFAVEQFCPVMELERILVVAILSPDTVVDSMLNAPKVA